MNITRRNFILGGGAAFASALAAPSILSCSKNSTTKSGLKTANFESDGVATFKNGLQDTYTANVPTELCVITNSNGLEACITNLGARLVSLMVPDKNGNFKDVVLGFDNIKDYADINAHDNVIGAEVGRTIDRIENAKFIYDGIEYHLEKNYRSKHNIHGGKFGWHYQTWTIEEQTEDSATFQLISPDGDGGFPGEVNVFVKYTLSSDNALWIDVAAKTTKASPLNISNHTYFNLEGDPTKDCYDNLIQIFSHRFIPVGEDVIPLDRIDDVPPDSALDFYSKPKTMSKDVDTKKGLFEFTKGYDFSFFLDANKNTNASLYSPKSGIIMEVVTDRPILRLYDAHDLDGTIIGKNNIAYNKMCAICMEAETVANGANNNNFLNTILKPGQVFTSSVKYKFSTQ